MLVRVSTLRLKRFCQKATCKVQHKHILAEDKKKQKPKEERTRRKETTCVLVD